MSSLHEYVLLVEPAQEDYLALLRVAKHYCDRALLVVRAADSMGEVGNEVLRRLQRFLVLSEDRSEWPGTMLIGATARVSEFSLSEELIVELGNAVSGLYGWIHPRRPEDLALLRPDGEAWLASSSHERACTLRLTLEELEALRAAGFQCPVDESI